MNWSYSRNKTGFRIKGKKIKKGKRGGVVHDRPHLQDCLPTSMATVYVLSTTRMAIFLNCHIQHIVKLLLVS